MDINITDKKLILVIPCYCDAVRLEKFLPSLCSVLQNAPISVALIIVDDGSPPKEQMLLKKLIDETKKNFPFVSTIIDSLNNQGKGAAIMKGWASCIHAQWYGFLDADGSVPAYEVFRFIHMLGERKSSEVNLFASRIQLRGRKITRSQTRHYSGRIFASIVGSFIDSQIYDSQCGFKIISQKAYKTIKPYLQEKRFAFDVELLAALNHFRFLVNEIPIDWFDTQGSKVSLFKDSMRMFFSVLTILKRVKKWPKYSPLSLI